MTFRENIIIFFVPLQIAFTDCGTSEAIVDPKTDSFTDCGTQEPLWTQNCYFKCCFCACFFTAYYYLWKYPRCGSFLPKKKMWSLKWSSFDLFFNFLCYFFCVTASLLFGSSSALLTVHCTSLSSLFGSSSSLLTVLCALLLLLPPCLLACRSLYLRRACSSWTLVR